MKRQVKNPGEHHAVCRWCRRYLKVTDRSQVKRQMRRRERRQGKKEAGS